MPRTFEERFAEQVDTLYRAALFLSAGERGRAEGLVTSVAVEAFREWQASDLAEEEDRPADLLSRLLAKGESQERDVSDVCTGSPSPIPWSALRRVPTDLRSALWLLVVERRPVDDACARLGVTTQQLWQRYERALRLVYAGAVTHDVPEVCDSA